MLPQRLDVPFVTASGGCTVQSAGFRGVILALIYTPAVTMPDDGVTLAATLDETGEQVLSATVADGDAAKTYYPRALTSVNTTGGATTTYEPIINAGGRLTIVIASAGTGVRSGVISIIYG